MWNRHTRMFLAALLAAVLLCSACGKMEPLQYRSSEGSETSVLSDTQTGARHSYAIDESLAASYDLPYEKGTYINTGHILYRPIEFHVYRTWEEAGVPFSDLPSYVLETTEYVPIRLQELEEWKEQHGDFSEDQQKEWDALHEDPPRDMSVLLMTVEVTNLDLTEEDLEGEVVRFGDGLKLFTKNGLERDANTPSTGVSDSFDFAYCDLHNDPNRKGYTNFPDFPEIGETTQVTCGFMLNVVGEEALKNNELYLICTFKNVMYGVAETCKMVIPAKEVQFDAK